MEKMRQTEQYITLLTITDMFHKAVTLEFKDGTVLEITFADGVVKQFDISVTFDKYPQLTALKDRDLFLTGKLSGGYGIIWNDDLDLEAETVYEEGVTVGYTETSESCQNNP